MAPIIGHAERLRFRGLALRLPRADRAAAGARQPSTSPTFAKARRSSRPAWRRPTCSSSSRASCGSSTRRQRAVASFGPHDTFDGRGCRARSAALCGRRGSAGLPARRQVVTELIARNATFGALLFSDLSNKLAAIAGASASTSCSRWRWRESTTIPAPGAVVDATPTSSRRAVLQAERSTNVLVRDRRAAGHLHRDGAAARGAARHAAGPLPVREVSSFGLITSRRRAPVGDALTVMVRHRCTGGGGATAAAHRGRAGGARPVELPVQSLLPDHREIVQAQDLEAWPARAAKSRACRPAAPRRHPGRPDRHAGAGAQRPAVPAGLGTGRPARAGRRQLPVRHGQRRPRRATAARPTRTTACPARWHASPADLDATCERFSARAARLRLSRLPGRHHGQQSRMARQREDSSARRPPLAAAARCRTADGAGDLPRCPRGGRRRDAAGRRAGRRSSLVVTPTTRCWPLCRGDRRLPRRVRRMVESPAALRRARRSRRST